MFNSVSVVLDPYAPIIDVSGTSPFVLNIDCKLLHPTKKVYKIEYDFGDNSPKEIKTLSAQPLKTNSSLPFPSEIADPRNIPTSHTFFVQDTEQRTFNIIVKSFFIENSEVPVNSSVHQINLNLKVPALDTKSKAISANFFEDVHLVSSRMFGIDNTLLYNFESYNPNYLLPTLVKWFDFKSGNNPSLFVYDPFAS
jgi:hypothetical protein